MWPLSFAVNLFDVCLKCEDTGARDCHAMQWTYKSILSRGVCQDNVPAKTGKSLKETFNFTDTMKL